MPCNKIISMLSYLNFKEINLRINIYTNSLVKVHLFTFYYKNIELHVNFCHITNFVMELKLHFCRNIL